MGVGGSRTRAVLSEEDASFAFGAILNALSDAVSPALIDADGWRRLRRTVLGLPVSPGAGFGFELRLGEVMANADVFVMLPRSGALAEHYIRHGEWEGDFGGGLAALGRGVAWSRLLAVEYDVVGGPPGLFVKILADPAGISDTAAEWLTGVVGWRLDDGERRALARTFDRMSAAGVPVEYLGIMPGRPERSYRIISRSMEPARALPVLENLGWNGPTGAIAAFLSRFDGMFRALRISFAVTSEGILPRVGLEFFQGKTGALTHPGAGPWGPFLSRLCEEGLCLTQKLDGLMAWPGRELVFCGRRTFGLMTSVAHVKVSFEARHGRTSVEAKAYPAAGYRPFDAIGPAVASR